MQDTAMVESPIRIQTEGYAPVVVTAFEDGGAIFHRVLVGEFRVRDGA